MDFISFYGELHIQRHAGSLRISFLFRFFKKKKMYLCIGFNKIISLKICHFVNQAN